MDNELVNEINNYRGQKLMALGNPYVTHMVKNAIETLMPGAMNGLQGLSAENDGITRALWDQAVTAAEMDGSLTFPQFRDPGEVIPEDAEPVSYTIAGNVIAGRVARAILVVNGMVKGYANTPDDWYGM